MAKAEWGIVAKTEEGITGLSREVRFSTRFS